MLWWKHLMYSKHVATRTDWQIDRPWTEESGMKIDEDEEYCIKVWHVKECQVYPFKQHGKTAISTFWGKKYNNSKLSVLTYETTASNINTMSPCVGLLFQRA